MGTIDTPRGVPFVGLPPDGGRKLRQRLGQRAWTGTQLRAMLDAAFVRKGEGWKYGNTGGVLVVQGTEERPVIRYRSDNFELDLAVRYIYLLDAEKKLYDQA